MVPFAILRRFACFFKMCLWYVLCELELCRVGKRLRDEQVSGEVEGGSSVEIGKSAKSGVVDLRLESVTQTNTKPRAANFRWLFPHTATGHARPETSFLVPSPAPSPSVAIITSVSLNLRHNKQLFTGQRRTSPPSYPKRESRSRQCRQPHHKPITPPFRFITLQQRCLIPPHPLPHPQGDRRLMVPPPTANTSIFTLKKKKIPGDPFPP